MYCLLNIRINVLTHMKRAITNVNYFAPVVVSAKIIQGVAPSSRTHFHSLSHTTFDKRPTAFNTLPVRATNAGCIRERVLSVVLLSVCIKMKFGDFDIKVQRRKRGLKMVGKFENSLPEFLEILTGNIIA